MEALVPTQKLLNDDAPVDGAAIPKEYNRPAQVPEKVVQESDDLHSVCRFLRFGFSLLGYRNRIIIARNTGRSVNLIY